MLNIESQFPDKVLLSRRDLPSPVSVSKDIVTPGNRYTRHGGQFRVEGEASQPWVKEIFAINTEDSLYFGRPAIASVPRRRQGGIILNLTKVFENPDQPLDYDRIHSGLGALMIGEKFRGEKILSIISYHPQDIFTVDRTTQIDLPVDDTFTSIDSKLLSLGLNKTAWELATSCIPK